MQSLKPLSSLYRLAGQFASYLVETPKTGFLVARLICELLRLRRTRTVSIEPSHTERMERRSVSDKDPPSEHTIIVELAHEIIVRITMATSEGSHT